MAQRIVDRLELVQIHKQHRSQAAVAGTGGQTPAQAVQQHPAVGKFGQRVIEGQALDRLLRLHQQPEIVLLSGGLGHANMEDQPGSAERDQHAEGKEPPGPIPRRKNSEGELGSVRTPHAIAVLSFDLQPVIPGRQLGKLQLPLRGLCPGGTGPPHPVAKDDRILTGCIQRGIVRQKRVGVHVKGRLALAGHIRPSHEQLGEHYLDGRLQTLAQARLETREPAAGADPDRAVRLRGKGVLGAVVPDQSIAHPIVVPVAAIPYIHAVIAARPHASLKVGFDEIHDRIRTGPFDVLFDGQFARLQMDAIHSADEPISNPYRSLGAYSQREYLLIPQPVGFGPIPPLPARKGEESADSAHPNRAIGPLDYRPDAHRGQFGDPGEILIRRLGHKEADIRADP
jgi:hypothetical protein